MDWPPLNRFGVVIGRPARIADVEAGHAAFVLSDGETEVSWGEPVEMPLPQYAIYVDPGTFLRTPCVAIQAEEIQGKRLIGCVSIVDGAVFVGYASDVELHGSVPPAE